MNNKKDIKQSLTLTKSNTTGREEHMKTWATVGKTVYIGIMMYDDKISGIETSLQEPKPVELACTSQSTDYGCILAPSGC